MRTTFVVAVAGAVTAACVQVSSAPPTTTAAPTPSWDAVVDYVHSDLVWLRDEFPRETAWWKDAYTESSRGLGVLHGVLAGQGTPSSTR